jgi:hypothetical protein
MGLRTRSRPRNRLRSYAPWIAVSGVATLGAAALEAMGFHGLQRFLGPLPPVVTVATAGAAGLGALMFLEGRGFWRCGTNSETVRGIVVATAAAIPLAAVAVGVDVARGFPKDTNLEWPEAWAAYLAIAVMAETAFHLLPLTGLVWLTRSHFTDTRLDGRVWTLVLTTAAVEPVAQVALGSAQPYFVVPHVFIIGVLQLLLLRRYGYLSMLSFRVSYYLIWHVLWGRARLALLF